MIHMDAKQALKLHSQGKIKLDQDTLHWLAADKVSKHAAYGRNKSGIFPDIGFYTRSKWERNYIRYLKYFNMAFMYEPKTFKFPIGLYKRNTSYVPDFYLYEQNTWIEVKGWMSPDSKTKIARFRKHFPEDAQHLRILQADWFKTTEKRLGKVIPNWE